MKATLNKPFSVVFKTSFKGSLTVVFDMRSFSFFSFPASISLLLGLGAVSANAEDPGAILRSAETLAAVQYEFTDQEEKLLDEIQRGCFEFLWQEVGSPVPLVKDRLTDEQVSSVAGVGFQLSALPIGVERKWITRAQAEERALKIMRSLIDRTDNKKFGIYLHYVDLNKGGMHQSKTAQVMAGTVDHALFQAGVMTIASYLGGEVEELAAQIVAEANWKAFEVPLNDKTITDRNLTGEKFISFGWRPEDEVHDLNAPGEFRPWSWYKASDEELLVNFLAVGSPTPRHAVDPDMYYRLHRTVKSHKDMSPFVVSWGGPAFTYAFAHCWIDYHRFAEDDPAIFGSNQVKVDWFENSRRAFLTHRQRCLEAIPQYKSFGEQRWGMSPAADINEKGKIGYIVQSLQPNLADEDNFCGGTVTPYAAGMAIMFMPEEAVAALGEFRNLKDTEGNYVVWRDPNQGGYGLLDSFNLDRTEQQGTPDYLSIDEGPMLLAIENARTGLIWKLFMRHPSAAAAVKRLKFRDYQLQDKIDERDGSRGD